MNFLRLFFVMSLALAFAVSAHAESAAPSPTLDQLQAIDAGGATGYQVAADGGASRGELVAIPEGVVSAAPANAPQLAPATMHLSQVVDAPALPPAAPRGEIGGISVMGAGVGAAVGYGAALLITATLYALPLWGTLLCVAGGALLGGFLLKKFF